MDLKIGSSRRLGARNIVRLYTLAAELHFAGNGQQRLKLVRHSGRFEIIFNSANQPLVPVQVLGGDRAMNGLTVAAVVLTGDVSRDQLPLPGCQRMGPRRRTSTRSFNGLAVSGRNAMGPRMPGSPSGSAMCAIEISFLAN